jgi:UDP-N-acetylglucosamine 2-epimerase (non-hydrolysing)
MKIMTVLGTRPEIVRLSRVIEHLDRHAEHVLVHTGQNSDERMGAQFFRDLGVRTPDETLNVRGAGVGAVIGLVLTSVEPVFRRHHPDRVLILGDTHSGMAAIVARHLGLPVYHMEAGNRSFDNRTPEETNRRVIDHCSTVLLPYTERSRQHLLREGIADADIHVTGNPIHEVLEAHAGRIESSRALVEHGLSPNQYFVATAHRAENVDHPRRLQAIVDGLRLVASETGLPMLFPVHPRTRSSARRFGIDLDGAGIRCVEPLGLFDFVALVRSARAVLTDSGTVQEEACLCGVPAITLRDATERPETVECGANVLAGADDAARIRMATRTMLDRSARWAVPAEYLVPDVAGRVCRIVLGNREPDAAEREWLGGDWRCR